jgi:acetolactate synthase I/II/III large subunit
MTNGRPGSRQRSGGQVLVDQLELHGAETAFCVPGESYLAVLDALRDSPIRLIVCRHEAGAANMAEAYGKLTGRPGICLVTRGPGATHASVGVHTAYQDSTPMLLLVGQVARRMLGRQAFQELDYPDVFGGLAKWAAQVDDARRLPELVARAFAVACAGRPGPVVLALPEDMLAEETDVGDAAPHVPARALPDAGDLRQLQELLGRAQRPLAFVGEGGWSARAGEDMVAFAEANELPLCALFRCQDYVDNRSRVYAGHLGIGTDPRLAERVARADLLLVVGGQLGEIATRGYTLLDVPRPGQTLIHVHPGIEELGRVYQPVLPIVSGLPEFASALRGLEPVDASAWRAWTQAARADYEDHLRHAKLPGDLELSEVMSHLRERLPEDAIFTCGAGNFTVWAHRFYEFSRFGTQLAPRSGAMGYGVPAALTAKLLHPERVVVCLAGDGDFLMSGQELATAAQYGLAVVILLVNNGMYGTIRMHQERLYPGRVVGTDLVNPDFVAYAESFGAFGELVERTEDFADAFERALTAGRPALLELRVDPEAISPRATISQIREEAP